jgi:hypothetical protein
MVWMRLRLVQHADDQGGKDVIRGLTGWESLHFSLEIQIYVLHHSISRRRSRMLEQFLQERDEMY